MRQSKHLFQHYSVTISCLALVLAGMLLFQSAFTMAAQQGYESPPVLSASNILPPELLSGPNFRVQERVFNDGFMNTYTIDSKFGTFMAVSTDLLRKRIQEINALAAMDKLKTTKEYLDSLKASGLS